MNVPSVIEQVARDLQTVERGSTPCVDMLSDAERDIIETAETAGYTRLGSGSDRVVLELDDSTVVKLARPPQGNYDGQQANKREFRQYRTADTDLKQILAPVHAVGADSAWLTMEKATAIRGYEHEIPQAFRDQCAALDITATDMLTWNIGYIPSKDRDCFIDYGNPLR